MGVEAKCDLAGIQYFQYICGCNLSDEVVVHACALILGANAFLHYQQAWSR